ncbi:hypothetical protein P4S64_19020 [Vibrio sp. M60_M31a]
MASFHDLVNRAWPKRRYTPSITKGLKYPGELVTLNDLMNVPYLDYGRDENGADCWGWLRWVRHHHHGLPLLKSFGTVDPDDKAGMTNAYHQLLDNYVETKPMDGAIACHLIGDTLVHVGVVVNEEWFEKSLRQGERQGDHGSLACLILNVCR